MSGFIGVDWGTSNLRVWRFDEAGAVIGHRSGGKGIAAVTDGDFAGQLAPLIGDWADGATPIILGGMVGSRNGWLEVPYVACPADPAAIGGGAIPVETDLGPAWIVPGLSHLAPTGLHDVMRGEEVQIAGAGVMDGIVALPGTHSKWARLGGGTVLSFRTFMTGELFAVLKVHSLLGRLMVEGPADEAAFLAGVRRSLADPALSGLLFSVRTEGLFGGIPPEGLADYLSGLLIGAEVAQGMEDVSASVTIVATRALAGRYAVAVREAGAGAPAIIDGEAASANGLLALGRRILEND
ncbi:MULTISPECIES: 2-dehydro-3-deoxygalactonokinase [Sphingomonas]|uniref:2-dehydro-3-deoxygalactonokinase n=1 Tax=Edaphosphingomonas fennica TaxID=114404 RepID=A0A2T4HT37_9SPHN|nr:MULTISPECIES: 2-dehydro-3-deoxygalactonokinase [Sphingomonas]AGH49661.1 2-dehydro-3-deoxygalactonokinase [Sphingomonas sp. MM-1]PTD18974.1 2-dehydro-3-deoxygalactonokinase [Sphingomonas fennica]